MGAGNPGMLELSFISLRMPDGTVYPLSGSVMDMNAGEFNISRKGILEAKNPSLDSRLTYVGIGLGSSALVAPPNGEKLSIGELSRVGIQDYSTDLALRNPDRVHEVVLASGTTLGVILTDPLTLSAREMPDSTTTMSRGAALRDATRYYQYDGRSWAVDLATGDRHPVSSGIMHAATGKYYSYHGHAYYMDSGTGARSQLD
jgi:hypothetical protein